MSYGFVIHTNFDEIFSEVAKLEEGNKAFMDEVMTFVNGIRDVTFKVQPAMNMETKDERQLWQQYQQLQRAKLVLLDLSHEYEAMQEKVKAVNPRLDFLIEDALEELKDHMNVMAETQRAH